MKTAIQELIEKYTNHLKHDDDLKEMSGKDILKIVLVDLISYQVKEKEQIIDAFIDGDTSAFNEYAEKYYLELYNNNEKTH